MNRSKSNGFTLIELIVVIVLIGIFISFAMLSMDLNSLDSELDEESNKIYALIKLAKEEAIIRAKEIALETDKQSYLFKVWTLIPNNTGPIKGTWESISNKIFRERVLNDGLKIHLETNEAVTLLEKEDDDSPNRVYFFSSGEQSEFLLRLSIRDDNKSYFEIEGKLNGELSINKIVNFQ